MLTITQTGKKGNLMAEKMKRRYRFLEMKLLRWWSAMIGFMLTLSGVTGCDFDAPMKNGGPAYGVQMVTLTIHGTVTSSADSYPIAGIKVSFDDQTTLTDSDGAYTLELHLGNKEDATYQVNAADIDGATNGSFQDETDRITAITSDYDTNGEANKELDITLDPKVTQ
jgi:putative lipoprotein (rSAM/lipoprotein system)